MRCLLLVLVTVSSVAAAQASDSGLPDSGVALTPPRLLEESPARFPPEAVDAGQSGQVELVISIDAQGEVFEVEQVLATNEAFAREAMGAATRLRFSPALCDGLACAVKISFTYRFAAPLPAVVAKSPDLAVVSGVVRQRGNREPISQAMVQSDDGQRTTTDDAGRFRIEVGRGRRKLRVWAAGFQTEDFVESVRRKQELEVIYTLLPLRINPFETVVRADRERTEVRRIELRDAEIHEVPGTQGDPFRVVMLLPGVSSLISGLAYPVVRGSSPASTGYFLDGVRVPQLFHAFLGPAVVSPEFIEGIDFFPGSAPVRYGRVLGGVVEGRIARAKKPGLRVSASIDELNSGAFAEYNLEKTDTRVSLAGRFSYTGWLLAALSQASQAGKITADFWDYQARVEQGALGGRLRLFAFGSFDLFGSEQGDDFGTSAQSQGTQFHRIDGRYRHPFGLGELEVGFTWGRDEFSFDSKNTFQGQVSSSRASIPQRTLGARLGWSADFSEQFSVSTQLNYENVAASFDNTLEQNGQTLVRSDPVASAQMTSGHVEVTYRPTPAFRLVPGVRFDHYFLRGIEEQTSADPRLSAFWSVGDALELRASSGVFHQAPTFLISLPVVDVASLRWGLQSAVQSSIGATWTFSNGWQLSADAYLNVFPRTVEFPLGDDEERPTEVDPNSPRFGFEPKVASGLGYGLDLMLRLPMKSKWFAWLTYSLQRSQRHTTYRLYNYLGGGLSVPGELVEGDLAYTFDQTHVANAVLSYRFDNGVSLGVTLHFNTGRPEDGSLTSRTSTWSEHAAGERNVTGWVPVSRSDVDRLPPFFRLDVRFSKTWLTDSFAVEFFIDVLNVLVRQEVIAFQYQVDYRTGQPLKQPLGIPVIIPMIGVKGRY